MMPASAAPPNEPRSAPLRPGSDPASLRTVANLALLALPLLLLAPLPAAPSPVDAKAIDVVVQRALESWNVPGVAVAIVRDDQVVYLKGHGLRDLATGEPVTPDTLFAIGSCTKAFTATALAVLVDEGKAAWDDPVRKHVPTFRLADPLADREVTLRDLVCHRTGLGRHDLLWYRAPWPVEESVRRMAWLEQRHSFRAAYEYNNLAYLAAGLAISSAAKEPWHEFARKRLFMPLGMKGAVFTRSDALKADHATPHRRGPDGKAEPMEWYPDDRQIRASGSIKAGVRDLSQWARMQLGGGALDGQRVVSEGALAETHTPQVVVPLGRARAKATGATQASYGLGWQISDYRGHHVLEHGGAVDGFRARIVLLPKDRAGVVLLTNLEEAGALQAAGNAVLDHVLGLPKKDWNAHFLRQRDEAEAARKERLRKRLAARQAGTKPSRELDAYAGRYAEPAYGTVSVKLEGKELALTWSSFRVPLKHFHYDTFIVPEQKARGPDRLSDEPAAFALDDDGEVKTLHFLGRKFTRK
jgi:CubicO group peptidase (beta-lactamase class C family)